MPIKIELNHTIVHAKNQKEAAEFITELFGLAAPERFGPYFLVVKLTNGVSLDYIETDQPYEKQHYAFLVSDQEWDQIFEKIMSRGIPYWADPGKKELNKTNTHFGGRGVYFEDPAGHFMEIITRPYGKWEA